MTLGVCILGSGSSGNATLIEFGKTRLLIDLGFSRDDLEQRLSSISRTTAEITHVLLTHTHTDHICASAFRLCHAHDIPLWCHPTHEEIMVQKHAGMRKLKGSDLVQHFGDSSWSVGDLRVQPLELPHDDPARTYGFVITTPCEGGNFKAGFVNDLGHVSEDLVRQLFNCDLLAIEHNHDPDLLWNSPRPYALKKRIRGPQGHLSNDQANQLLGSILEGSTQRLPSHVFLTHMSQECNTAELAVASAQSALDKAACEARLHVAFQDRPTEMVRMNIQSESGPDQQLSLWEKPQE